jgi:hypothetical protein
MHSCPAKRRLSVLNAISDSPRERVWFTEMAHCSTYLVCWRKASQESRNLDQTGDIGTTDAGTCAEFFENPYYPKNLSA